MQKSLLCRALSESKLKAQLELSANDTCALKEDELKAKYEFSAAAYEWVRLNCYVNMELIENMVVR